MLSWSEYEIIHTFGSIKCGFSCTFESERIARLSHVNNSDVIVFWLRSSLNWYTRVLIHFLFKFSFIYLFFPSFIHFFQLFDCSLVGSFVPLFSLFLCSFIRVHTSISTYGISYVLQIRYKIVSNVISITAWTVFSDECSKFFLLKLRWPMDPQTINAMYSFNENEISKYHKVWFISPSFIFLFISAWLLFVDFTYFCMISKL